MVARRTVSLVLLFALVVGIAGPSVRPALAGADVCPEPNSDFVAACFLGPGGAAPGFIDTPDDVDSYRIELTPDSMVTATLGGLPADYILRLHSPDGSPVGEAAEPGTADKTVRADGIAAGTYYLVVSSVRGESNPDAPYLISVSYPASLVLTPAAPAGSAPAAAYGYVPAPAKAYGLVPADVGPGFREAAREESEDGRAFGQLLLARDVFDCPNITPPTACSNSGAGEIETLIIILPYGSNDELTAAYNEVLNVWRSRGWNVEPTVGWGSEQVYSFAQAAAGVMVRGIALKHRNAIVRLIMTGFDRHATWDNAAGKMRAIEGRIHVAIQ
jgi:hypothetical protein